ncbi:uncharacterized protein Dvir_GJ19324, isoform B [Drosophila virilis]|uniref:Uncharacterized protein, isoform B n=1 Tax=Drosophila virilis TaxID=7244 RepID=A0A0Q9WNF8_DROVI|nr:uncharacterized protein Dvir_GJ19324, isoform B [Drosophila virilis]
MPAGIVKTPNTTRANDANATKSADRSGNDNGSSGKKFVQTRLPFKLITPVAKAAAAAAASPTPTATTSPTASASSVVEEEQLEREPRKRKLSYGCGEEPVAEQLRRSNSKENLGELGVSGITSSKKPKTTEAMSEEVIELDDDDDVDDDDAVDVDVDVDGDVKDPAADNHVKEKKVKEKSAESASHPAPIQIKLPLSNKRGKRRKSLRKAEKSVKAPPAAEPSDSSDDIEVIANSLNPQKRPKTKLNVEAKSNGKAKTIVKTDLESKPNVPAKADVKSTSGTESKAKDESKSDKESNKDVDSEVMLLDSSDNDLKPEENAVAEQSSTDLDMDVDTDTLNKTSPEKEREEEGEEEEEEEVHKSAGSSASAAALVPKKPEKLQNLTPKQQKLMEQRRKAREEKERKLQEERRLKLLEKEQREQQKKAARDVKEELRRKEREDKEELKRKEREEKERKRQVEHEEKRKRNEAKEEVQRKKDEERRRKEQEKEEAEEKKKRAAASFTKFFVPKQPKQSNGGSLDHEQNSCDSGPSHSSSQQLAFRPFQVKDDMILAPVIRATLGADTRQQLDSLFLVPDDQDEEEKEELNNSIGRVKRPTRAQLYLSELSLGKHKPLASKRDARLQRSAKDEEDDDDVQVIDDLANAGTPIVEERPKQLPWTRAKYLHFADNRRPPYYGTWRKRSQVISARRPLGQDKNHFDYEVDSDCEWEEEEPGESLSASEDEKERESEEESEEEYNEWFVPHGHLSDEELQNDGELEDGNTREAQKAKLQVLQQEFAQEMKKQTKKIKPRLLGPVWLDESGNKSQLCPAVFIQTIDMYGCWQLQPLTLEPPPESVGEEEPPEEVKAKPSTMQLDEQLLQQLVRLIHGNSNAKAFLISEYLEYLKTQIPQESQTLLPPKTLLREKFDELASWKPVELGTGTEAKRSKKPKKRLCWVVNAEMLHKFNLDKLTLQNQWSYTLTPKISKTDTSLREATPPADAAEACSTPKSDDNKREESAPRTSITGASTGTAATAGTASPAATTKKRGTLLMSVPRDQQFHAPTKNALISQYLRKHNETTSRKNPSPAPMTDDVVLLSD